MKTDQLRTTETLPNILFKRACEQVLHRILHTFWAQTLYPAHHLWLAKDEENLTEQGCYPHSLVPFHTHSWLHPNKKETKHDFQTKVLT